MKALTSAAMLFWRADRAARARMSEYVDAVCGLKPFVSGHPTQIDCRCYPGLEARAVHSPEKFAWVASLEQHWQEILAEYENLERLGAFQTHQQTFLLPNGNWDTFYLWSADAPLPGAREFCPRTLALLSSIEATRGAGRGYFSVMRPGTRVLPHTGPINTRLRVHLALSVPQECGIKVGGESFSWQEGKCLVFDDSLTHEVWNDSGESRVVLLFDFWHPDLTAAERKTIRLLESFTDFRNQYTDHIAETQSARVRHIQSRQTAEASSA